MAAGPASPRGRAPTWTALALVLVLVCLPGCAYSSRVFPGREDVTLALVRELDEFPRHVSEIEQCPDGGTHYHGVISTGGWHILGWVMTFGLVIGFPPAIDVVVQPDPAGTRVAVRVRDHTQLFFLFPLITRDEAEEARILDGVTRTLAEGDKTGPGPAR